MHTRTEGAEVQEIEELEEADIDAARKTQRERDWERGREE